MTQAERLFVIVWIINLIVAVIYCLCGSLIYVPVMKQKDKDDGLYEYLHDDRKTYIIRTIVMILCPVLGPLYFLASYIIFRTIFRQEVDLEDVVFGKDKARTHLKADEERERNMVPLEEALAVSDNKNLRTLMLSVIKEDLQESLESIALALNSEDSETSHYAASVLRDELNDFRIRVQKLYTTMKSEESDVDDAEILMVDYMDDILSRKIFTGLEQEKFVGMMAEAGESMYEKKPEDMTQKRCESVCLRLIELKRYDEARVWCDRLSERYPNELITYTCRLKLSFAQGDRESFLDTLGRLKKSDVVIDRETLELIRVFS